MWYIRMKDLQNKELMKFENQINNLADKVGQIKNVGFVKIIRPIERFAWLAG